MKVLVTGCNGQLGRQLLGSVPDVWYAKGLSRDELDICDRDAVLKAVDGEKPDLLVNAAAYTAVDQAEQAKQKAYAINAVGPENLAEAIKLAQGRMIHISTDFVFDGQKPSPYLPTDKTNPISVYGASKLEGELQVLRILEDKAAIVRTAWVYSDSGNNFALTMLRLMREKDELGVVSDQVGTPTWAGSLANAIWDVAAEKGEGIYHKTDSGVASWYDFAVAIYEEAVAMGMLDREVFIKPISTSEYPTPAQRPPYSVLDNTKIQALSPCSPRHWRQSLRLMLEELE